MNIPFAAAANNEHEKLKERKKQKKTHKKFTRILRKEELKMREEAKKIKRVDKPHARCN